MIREAISWPSTNCVDLVNFKLSLEAKGRTCQNLLTPPTAYSLVQFISHTKVNEGNTEYDNYRYCTFGVGPA